MKLKKFLQLKDLTLSWLARQIGVTRSTVFYWSIGKATPRNKYFPLISKALNIGEEQVKELFK